MWRSMRKLALLIVAGAYFASVSCAEEPTHDPSQPVEASFWMKKKLKYSQAVFEGIALADFDQILENAETMQALNRIEEFARRRNPEYNSQLLLFQTATQDIIAQAKRENVDGAALAFTQLTISCVKCHKHLRSEAQASKPKPE